MKKIMIVDDEPGMVDFAQESLLPLGYRIITALSAEQALELFETTKIDLLFSDVILAGELNGYDLAEQATGKCPALKVLLTSGYTELAIAHNGQARFKANLLTKPYTRTQLNIKIRDTLSSR